ncbi:beta-3 adrenergic receptor-like [Paramacrobiotus metropolitanus]|uniref:beta-3 adrenergic receptor-like n=1 Tax=Paramacrobiotus metropolitanus TaxID=2943436 RepID=UPI002445835F|nr:beta-3 adrenergic receptor-like [Paramacrobiotus metropolitanus]
MANSTSQASGNGSFPGNIIPFQLPNTTVVGWSFVPVALCSIIANLALITVYCKTPSLRTPFGIYVVSLATVDALQSCILSLNNIATFLQIAWPYGAFYCSLVMYLGWVLIGLSNYIHLLITLNRLWAVTFPNSYRTRHNKTFACAAIIVAFAFIQVLVLPGSVVYEVRFGRYRPPYLCAFDFRQMMTWGIVASTVLNTFPNVAIMVLYPIVYYKVHSRVQDSKVVLPLNRTNFPNSNAPSTKSTGISGTLPSWGNANSAEIAGGNKTNHDVAKLPAGRRQYNGRRHFAILTALVISAVFCWTPINVVYTLMLFDIFNLKALAATTLIFFLDTLLNPLMYPLASQEWRDAFKRLLR